MSIGNLIFRKFVFINLLLVTFCSYAATDLKVEKITFIGNSFFSAKELKKIIKSKAKKPFDARLMKLDQVLLTNWYLRNGFLKVFVNTEFRRKANQIFLEYTINEGKQYYLNQLKFVGNKIITDNELKKKIPHDLHKPYRSNLIQDGISKIEKYYFNNGKPYVDIKESPEFEQDSLINLTIQIDENQTVSINEIQIMGLNLVRRYVARREIEINEGDIYSQEKIERSQRNLYGTGLFNFVHFQIVELDSSKSAVKLIVNVNEKKSKWIGLKAGVAYEQEIIYGGTFDFGIEGGHRNLFGTGRTASASIIPSLSYDFGTRKIINPKNQYSFTYVEPRIFYSRTRGILKIAYFQARPSQTANYNFLSTSFQITHEYINNWTFESEIAYQNVNTDSLELLTDTQGQDRIYSISFDLIQDKRDNYLNTQRGHLMEFTNKFVYSNSYDGVKRINRFIKLTSLWNRYQAFPLYSKWVLASRIRGGAIIGINKITRIPPTERFYLGGASSVRGYPEQLLGPVQYDEAGNAIAKGGRYMILGNLELRVPLFWLFYGEFFTDGGNVWTAFNRIKILSPKMSSGSGIAIMTPLGAIRFDYGLKWFPQRNESKGEFHIGISFAF